jgi:hypothetical protein
MRSASSEAPRPPGPPSQTRGGRGTIAILLTLWLGAAGGFGAEQPRLLTAKELADARKLYVGKCAKCHKFYEPRKYTDADWRTWMDSMSRKSKLKPNQEELLNRYLDAYRSGQIERHR